MGTIYIPTEEQLVFVRKKLGDMGATSIWSGTKGELNSNVSDAELKQILFLYNNTDEQTKLELEAKYGKTAIPPIDSVVNIKLDDAKLLALKYVKVQSEFTRENTSSNRRPLEIQQLASKAEIAKRFIAGNASAEEEATLSKEAELRGLGETTTQLATLQIEKANEFSMVRAVIDGFEKKFTDLVNNTTMVQELKPLCVTFFDSLVAELELHFTG